MAGFKRTLRAPCGGIAEARSFPTWALWSPFCAGSSRISIGIRSRIREPGRAHGQALAAGPHDFADELRAAVHESWTRLEHHVLATANELIAAVGPALRPERPLGAAALIQPWRAAGRPDPRVLRA